MLPTLPKKPKLIRLFIGLFLFVGLHCILYYFDLISTANKQLGYQDNSLVIAAYATALLAAGGELGLVVFKNLLLRISNVLLLVPYFLFVAVLTYSIGLSASQSNIPINGSAIFSSYHGYLTLLPFAVSILLFLGLIRIAGHSWYSRA